jgi:peptidoglycan hydrolase-like protein with peptidoglycan-binding domain
MTIDAISGSSQPQPSYRPSVSSYRAAPSIDAALHGDCIQRGQQGPSVQALQQQLNTAGAHPPLDADGVFGARTDQAVRQFQQSHGLKADGVVGPKTLQALHSGGSVEGESTRRSRSSAATATGSVPSTTAPTDPQLGNRPLSTTRGITDNNTLPSDVADASGRTTQPATGALPAGEKVGTARGTGYYPANNRMEGGFNDKQGKPLHTLQDFLAGRSDYVSIALDKNLYRNGDISYGDRFRIPELEAKYGRQIEFRAVDTGGAFTNRGFGRVDICTASRAASLDPTINGPLTLRKID